MKLTLEVEEGEDEYEGYRESVLFAEEMVKCFDLMRLKQQTYGSAWRRQGWMGQTARILSKVSRLEFMLWRGMQMESDDEGTEDTVRDLVNLGIFWLLNKKAGNQWGRGLE